MVSGRLVLETARLRVTALSNIRFKGKNKWFTISWRIQRLLVTLTA
jgi:hypothetical protein